jgi:hypothetical protein
MSFGSWEPGIRAMLRVCALAIVALGALAPVIAAERPDRVLARAAEDHVAERGDLQPVWRPRATIRSTAAAATTGSTAARASTASTRAPGTTSSPHATTTASP